MGLQTSHLQSTYEVNQYNTELQSYVAPSEKKKKKRFKLKFDTAEAPPKKHSSMTPCLIHRF